MQVKIQSQVAQRIRSCYLVCAELSSSCMRNPINPARKEHPTVCIFALLLHIFFSSMVSDCGGMKVHHKCHATKDVKVCSPCQLYLQQLLVSLRLVFYFPRSHWWHVTVVRCCYSCYGIVMPVVHRPRNTTSPHCDSQSHMNHQSYSYYTCIYYMSLYISLPR